VRGVTELLAEVADVDLDVVLVTEEVVTPDLVENALAGKDLAGIAGEIEQQVVLADRQFHHAVTGAHLASRRVDAEVARAHDPREIRVAAPEHGPNARQQLGEVEGFDEVVVSPQLEPLDAIADLVAGAEDDDSPRAVTGQRATEIPTVDARHHQVEDDEMWLEVVNHSETGVPVGGGANVEALVAETERDEVGDALLVIDDEDAGRLSHRLEYMGGPVASPGRDDLVEGFSALSQRPTTLALMSQTTSVRARAADGLGRAEVHAHTLASDGMVSAEELVDAAAAIGLNVVCVTDHDTMTDLGRATELGASLGVEVVRGEEVTTSFPPGIHIVGLFLEHQVRMHMSVEDTVEAIHDAGGLAVIAHPFMPTWFASMTPGRARRLLRTHPVDAVELRHTAPVLPRTWGLLDAFYAKHREQLGAAIGAGDSHFGAHDLGRVLTVFPGRTAADLRRAIEERSTSPLSGSVSPSSPPLKMRVAQQYRSMVWLAAERRAGRVGAGAGPAGR
jgi:PHP domain